MATKKNQDVQVFEIPEIDIRTRLSALRATPR